MVSVPPFYFWAQDERFRLQLTGYGFVIPMHISINLKPIPCNRMVSIFRRDSLLSYNWSELLDLYDSL